MRGATVRTRRLEPGVVVWASIDRYAMTADPLVQHGAEVLTLASVRRLRWHTYQVKFTKGAAATTSSRLPWRLA